jgi:transposase InsO family protein
LKNRRQDVIAGCLRPAAGRIVHSDRGSQYCSKEFQDALRAYGMRSSMSRKADCWNALTENLWGSLKRARTHGKRFAARQAAQSEVLDWMAFYNAARLHSTLGYVSPMKYEKNWLAAQARKSA